MSQLLLKSKLDQGFTLVEMLVTVAISLLIIAIGAVNYLDFNARQKILSAAQELEVILQLAQAKARSGDLGDCDQLDSYQVSFDFNTNPALVTVRPNCVSTLTGAIVSGTIIKSYTLVSDVALTPTPNITSLKFPALNGGLIFTPNTANVVFKFSNPSITSVYKLTLSRGGDFGQGLWQ